MTTLRIRACTHNDIDTILHLDHQWEQEEIAHVFIPVSREEFIAQLEHFPAYFLVAEYDGAIIGYINGSVHRGGETTRLCCASVDTLRKFDLNERIGGEAESSSALRC